MAPSQKNTQKWDEKTHEAVLIAIIGGVTFDKAQWTSIMTVLGEQGFTSTESALRYVVKADLTECWSPLRSLLGDILLPRSACAPILVPQPPFTLLPFLL